VKHENLKAAAAAALDALSPERRVLACCLFQTCRRDQLAEMVAKKTLEAIGLGLTSEKDPRRAVDELLEVYIDAHVDDMEAVYAGDRGQGRTH
jgi:hypothetical protein